MNSINYVNPSTKISRVTSQTRRSNMNSFDKVSSIFLLPRMNPKKKSNHSTIPRRERFNLHLYRLHAISKNIKSIFVREEDSPTRYAPPHIQRFIAML